MIVITSLCISKHQAYTLNINNFLFFQNYKAYQKAKTSFKETEQESEPDMAEMLELSDQES